jgi:hypothetical protein
VDNPDKVNAFMAKDVPNSLMTLREKLGFTGRLCNLWV